MTSGNDNQVNITREEPSNDPRRADQLKAILKLLQGWQLGNEKSPKMIDVLIFLLVYLWVMVKYPDQVDFYNHWNRTTKLPPHPVIPRCINDKFLWRKLFDHNPEFTTISDKLAVKDWVVNENIEVSTAKTLWWGYDARQIPPDILSGDVVVKANHGWNMNIIIRQGNFDHDDLVEKANGFLHQNHGAEHMQWGYLNVPRKLFVEEYLSTDENPVIELKYYTFGSRLERLIVIYDRFGKIAADVWMPDENGIFYLTDEKSDVSKIQRRLPLPPSAERAEKIARKIGSRFDHMRVDIYTNGQEIWLSELTIYSLAGHIPKYGEDLDVQMNAAWDIRNSWFLSTPQKGWRALYARALRRTLSCN
jgi:hypothetical protein